MGVGGGEKVRTQQFGEEDNRFSPKWKILLKSLNYGGVSCVSAKSDPWTVDGQ